MILFIVIYSMWYIDRLISHPFLIECISIFEPFYKAYFSKAENASFDLAYTSACAQYLV